MRNYSLFLRLQVQNYVLFLVGRVGSTYLTSVLSSHPHILALGEELAELEKDGVEAQAARANELLSPPLIGRKRVRGFNVKLVHLADPSRFAGLLKEKNCKVVHMLRRNRVKSVISRMNGERLYRRTGMWGLFKESDRLPPLTVDLKQFDEYLKHRERVDAELDTYVRGLALPTLTIPYEDMLRAEHTVFKRIFSFFGVDDIPVQGETLKITGDDLREALANFDELRSRYIRTQYEPMFDEVIAPAQGARQSS